MRAKRKAPDFYARRRLFENIIDSYFLLMSSMNDLVMALVPVMTPM